MEAVFYFLSVFAVLFLNWMGLVFIQVLWILLV